MIRHISLMRFTPDTTAAQEQAIIDALLTLPAMIAELLDYRIGLDAGLSEGNYRFAVTADCADVEGYLAYRDHPEHQRILAELIRPVLAERAAVQYDI